MTIFDGLSRADVQRIKKAGMLVRLPTDWSPISERTPADKAYIIVSGEVSVRRDQQEIATLGPGDVMGEAAILNHSLRTASIVTTTPVEVLHFTAEQLTRLNAEVPAFHDALERAARARLPRGPGPRCGGQPPRRRVRPDGSGGSSTGAYRLRRIARRNVKGCHRLEPWVLRRSPARSSED